MKAFSISKMQNVQKIWLLWKWRYRSGQLWEAMSSRWAQGKQESRHTKACSYSSLPLYVFLVPVTYFFGQVGTQLKVRRQFLGVHYLLPLYGTQRPNSFMLSSSLLLHHLPLLCLVRSTSFSKTPSAILGQGRRQLSWRSNDLACQASLSPNHPRSNPPQTKKAVS